MKTKIKAKVQKTDVNNLDDDDDLLYMFCGVSGKTARKNHKKVLNNKFSK